MGNKKNIRVQSNSRCAIDRQFKPPWEDIWLIVKDKRNNRFFAPCICAKSNLEHEIELQTSLCQDHPGIPEFNDELAELKNYWQRLQQDEEFIIEDNGDGLPNIYVKAEMLDKAVIEKALSFYLATIGLLKTQARFQWQKPKHFVFSA